MSLVEGGYLEFAYIWLQFEGPYMDFVFSLSKPGVFLLNQLAIEVRSLSLSMGFRFGGLVALFVGGF